MSVLSHYAISASSSGYQKWVSYPDSPLNSDDFPYQLIAKSYSDNMPYLYACANPMYREALSWCDRIHSSGGTDVFSYKFIGGLWVASSGGTSHNIVSGNFYEANRDIFADITLTNVYFNKTTSAAQDLGIIAQWVRIR